MTFTERIRKVQTQRNSLICIGLDTSIDAIPEHLKSANDPILEFNKQIIEATSDMVCAYKPNLAFYEALGQTGFKTLYDTLKLIPSSILKIGDGKRGDIGNTSIQYAKSLFEDFDFDAVTVNPYMGYDSVEPFLKYTNKGIFILTLTSNPSSKDFQRLKIGTRPLYERVVLAVKKWNKEDNIGLVVGATHPKELKRIRKIVPNMPLLIPGIGKQGGDLKSVIRYGCSKDGYLVIINVGRSIIYASSGKDFAEAARKETEKILKQIQSEMA